MDLTDYRESDAEQKRTDGLMKIVKRVSDRGETVLDIGARDGYFSKILTNYFERVSALDLVKPTFSHQNILCVQGDITDLNYNDNSFDFVFCAEVLEHIPSHLVERACSELSRVTKKYLLIGVPYKQDIRFGRTTCYSCGGKNPPWGHVNSFDRQSLINLFPIFNVESISYVGENIDKTNPISAFLMDLAGNPYGTYRQDEGCIYCGENLKSPPERTFIQKIFTRTACYIRDFQLIFQRAHPNWIHILFRKTDM